MESKIYNKKSKRMLTVGGTQYNQLLKQGYNINQTGELSPPKSVIKMLTSLSNKYGEIKNIISNIKLWEHLPPKDLLSLYLSNKDIEHELNNKKVIDMLNNKYNTKINTNLFTEWYRNYTLVNHQLKDLYDLENIRYINQEIPIIPGYPNIKIINLLVVNVPII